MTKPKQHGPGHWLCWSCFDAVSNWSEFRSSLHLITKPTEDGWYRSKGGVCDRCHKKVYPGDLAAKVTLDVPLR